MGSPGFLEEIDRALEPHVGSLRMIVVDDASKRHHAAGARVGAFAPARQARGSDLRRVLVLLVDQAHAVSGVRRLGQDSWFRMAVTRLVRSYVRVSLGVNARDRLPTPAAAWRALMGRAVVVGDLPTHVQYFTRGGSLRTLLARHGWQVRRRSPRRRRRSPSATTLGRVEWLFAARWRGRSVSGAQRGRASPNAIWAPDFRDRMGMLAQAPASAPTTGRAIA